MNAIAEPLILGSSAVLDVLRNEVQSAARSDARVLIEGETGVGKDVVARRIHWLSRRKSQRFIAVNCAGLPDTLLESELFGHVRGSFTGAFRDKSGLAALADGGTLFLDEASEMSPRMQAVLLRFTENGEIQPVGSDRPARSVNVRLIAATNQSLSERVASNAFRNDLFYRLNVIHLRVPPLRERGQDVVVLFGHFIEEFARAHRNGLPVLTDEAQQALLAYNWPGNIRELRNLAEQVVVKCGGRSVDRIDLPVEVQGDPSPDLQRGLSGESPAGGPSPAERAWNLMVQEGQTFWTAVYEPFMEHELTKADVRFIMRRGLRQTSGSYRQLTNVFHMTAREYRRFLAFLHQHDCHVTGGTASSAADTRRPLVRTSNS